MPSKFGGIPIEETGQSKFGGVPIDAPAPAKTVKAAPALSFLQRVGVSSSESNPLAQPSWVNSGAPSPSLGDQFKELGRMAVPGPGNYGAGSPLNLVHAVPFVGPSLANIGNEVSEGRFPEAIGHATGLVQGIPEGPAPPSPGIGPQLSAEPTMVPKWAEPNAPAPSGMGGKIGRAVLNHAIPGSGMALDIMKSMRDPSAPSRTPYPEMPAISQSQLNRSLTQDPPRMADPSGTIKPAWENPRFPSPKPVWEHPPITPGTGVEPEAAQVSPPITPARPVSPISYPPNPYASRFPERAPLEPAKPRAPVQEISKPTSQSPLPKTGETSPLVSAPEAANREALARDLAEVMHLKGNGISYADAAGIEQGSPHQAAVRQAADSLRGKPPTGKIPSPETWAMALRHLKAMEAATQAAKENANAQSHLKGRSLSIAQQLAEEVNK